MAKYKCEDCGAATDNIDEIKSSMTGEILITYHRCDKCKEKIHNMYE